MSRQVAGTKPERVFLGLGTNMGDRLRYLRRALYTLGSQPEIRVQAVSGIYETEFVGEGQQDPYYNACVQIETTLAPAELLAFLKTAEQSEGRGSDGHLKPRPIDLDILLFGDKILTGERLHVPHKGMRDRAFVLEPLTEIAAAEKFPDSGETIAEACAKIRRKSGPWIVPLTQESLLPAKAGESRPWDLNKDDWRPALEVHCR